VFHIHTTDILYFLHCAVALVGRESQQCQIMKKLIQRMEADPDGVSDLNSRPALGLKAESEVRVRAS
jgi:hypothetical protein